MVTPRRGHTIVELLVALTVLGSSAAAIAAASLAGARHSTLGVQRQGVVRAARSTIDSLVRSPTPPAAGRSADPWPMEWTVAPLDGDAVLVTVSAPAPGGAPPLRLAAAWTPPPAPWPGP